MPGLGPFVLRLVAWADGGTHQYAGRYLQDSDIEKVDGMEPWLLLAEDPAEAKTFTDVLHVLTYLRRSPLTHPLRETDGKPDRPLTAYTWECISLTQALREAA